MNSNIAFVRTDMPCRARISERLKMNAFDPSNWLLDGRIGEFCK